MERNYEDRFMEMAKRVEKGWKRYDRMVDRPIRPLKALRFLEEDIERVDSVLDELTRENLLELFKGPSKHRPSVILPEKYFDGLIQVLDEQWISYVEAPVVAVSALPVVDQRIIRNMLYQWEDLIFLIEDVRSKGGSSFGDEREEIIWETIKKAKEAVVNLSPEETINPKSEPIYFDLEYEEKGFAVAYTQGRVRGTIQKDVILVSNRTLTILNSLQIPYKKGYPKN